MFKTFASAIALSIAISSPAAAMCGGGKDQAAKAQSSPSSSQCGGMGNMEMGTKVPEAGTAKDDPHAGMNMDGDKSKAGMGCSCGCCGSSAKASCGKQAALNEDGSNDPLPNDPMWTKPSTKSSVP